MTPNEKDSLGNFVIRFAKDGKISALLYFQGIGIPVYRLKTQLRMAKGMFDTVANIIYPYVPYEYSDSCAVDLPEFQAGRDLEDFVPERYPEITPAPTGTFQPVFMHCIGSRVFTDDLTGSKRSPDQVRIALDFIVDLVKSKKVNPAQIVVIAPYAANVDLTARMRKQPRYAMLARTCSRQLQSTRSRARKTT